MIRRALALLLLLGCAGPPSLTLTVERIYAEPPLIGTLPQQVRWRDARTITFVENKKLVAFDIETGVRSTLAAVAPTAYRWSNDGKLLLLIDGELRVGDRRVAGVSDPQWSPDGELVSFLRDHDLWIIDLAGKETRLTTGGSEFILNGELDWVYPEELGIASGYVWSEDSSRIAFLQLDETSVMRFPIVDYQPVKGAVHWMFYPKAGESNPVARVGVITLDGKIEWTAVKDEYVARMEWKGGRLFVETLNRAQTKLTIWVDGKVETVEEDPAWVDVREIFPAEAFRHKTVGLERHFFKGEKQLTTEPGWHDCTPSPDGTAWFDVWSNGATRPTFTVGRWTLGSHPPLEALPRPEFMGRSMILKPADFDPRRKYPVIVYSYGGPGSQVVANRWPSMYLWHSMMTQRGFVVFVIDVGIAKKPLKQLGKDELEGLLAGVEWLKSQPYVDPSRIGFWGWSYGGYLACYAMTHSDAFRAGVAVAPVTDWRDYDTIYTERYLKTPQENAEGYRLSAPDPAALRGRLLLVHGLADDNVHWQNTVQFVEALIMKNAKFDLMVYPRRDHSIWGREVRTHLFETMTEFFERELLPGRDFR